MLLAPTLADGLAAFYGGRSKVFGVSGKDRSAVAMAGQVGKAFWYSTNTGDFVTSTYYFDAYPNWGTKPAVSIRTRSQRLPNSTV